MPLRFSRLDRRSIRQLNPGEMIMNHIKDSHEWHFATYGSTHITLPLPVILYSNKSLHIFSSSRFHNESHNYQGFILDEGVILQENGAAVYDFSITKNVASMFISIVIMLVIFVSVARRYKKNTNKAPKGLQSLIEPIIVFIKDEVAIPMLGNKYHIFLPYLLTAFFFIWINNMMGLLPGSANVTGNISVTITLALMTALIVNLKGNKHYWRHIFAPPGVPIALVPLLALIEFLGIFIKPFALMIRLFANITAGHVIILSIIGLIFIFSQTSVYIGLGVSVLSVAFAIFLYLLELLVAVLQAYIFTILSALFIGDAIAGSEEH